MACSNVTPASSAVELEKSSPASNLQQPIVKLNAGGVRYETSLTTLMRYPESMFATWFANWKKENQEEYFIDFDGEIFKFVLDFLRYGESAILPEDERSVQRLLLAADYFQLPGLQRHAASLNANTRGLLGVDLSHGETVKFSEFGIANCADSYALTALSWLTAPYCTTTNDGGNSIVCNLLGLTTVLLWGSKVSSSVFCPACGISSRSDPLKLIPQPSLQDELAKHREVFQSEMLDVVFEVATPTHMQDSDCAVVLDKKLKANRRVCYHVAKRFLERSV